MRIVTRWRRRTNLRSSCSSASSSGGGGGGGGKSSTMVVSFKGGVKGGGGGRCWKKTSSKSSWEFPVEALSCWGSKEPERLDSEILREDRWRRDGWEDGGGVELPLVFLSGGRTDEGETGLVLSSERLPIHSRLKARFLHSSSRASPETSLRLCLSLVGLSSLLLMSIWGTSGKLMASRLAWLSLSLALHSVASPSWVPAGGKGQGRPTDAARVEVLWARWRSPFLCRSLRVTGVWEWSKIRTKEQG